MKKTESLKRVVALHMDFAGLLSQLAIYAYYWFYVYYPILQRPRFTTEGYEIGAGLHLYFRGHALVLAIYFVLLLFFSRTYGGMGAGYQKALSVFFSQIFALLMVNAITYFQIALMRNWLVVVRPMVWCTLLQLAASFVWTQIADKIYVAVFPARKMLLITSDDDADAAIAKFQSRSDRYVIETKVSLKEGEDAVNAALDMRPAGVVLWDIDTKTRNDLLKRCYAKTLRVYIMPKITDVLMKGAEEMHLVDTPLYVVGEYAMRVEQRFLKRLIDLVLATLLVVLTSPIMLATAIAIKCYDKGPVLYKQTRCTIGKREFRILKFRSMRMDAEKDGVARLAAKGDPRVTPIGKIIRPVRIDELPQLFNILKGDMTFIGPRPERPEIIDRYLEEMPEFAYRLRVKAGLAGYAQIYGRYNTTPYDKLKLDLTYIENYSVWLDLRLMLLTLKILFTPESAEGVDEEVQALSDGRTREGDGARAGE